MENFKKNVKNAIVYGAAILAMGKAGEKLKEQRDSLIKNNNTYTEANSDVSNSLYVVQDDDGSVVDPHEQIKSEPDKAWLLKFLKSESYKKKAYAEGLTDQDIRDRITRLENTPIFRKDVNVFSDGSDGFTLLMHNDGKAIPIIKVAADADPAKVSHTIIHESEHAATSGNSGLSAHAKELYKESFRWDQDNKYSKTVEYENYLREYTERDARKKELEFEAEKLGIIKAGQKITKKDYIKIIDAYNMGKFGDGANQFIETTKPEYFIQIMNEIANNQENQNHNDVLPYNLPTEQQG